MPVPPGLSLHHNYRPLLYRLSDPASPSLPPHPDAALPISDSPLSNLSPPHPIPQSVWLVLPAPSIAWALSLSYDPFSPSLLSSSSYFLKFLIIYPDSCHIPFLLCITLYLLCLIYSYLSSSGQMVGHSVRLASC